MPRIAQHCIDQIKQQADFVELVSPYVTLKRAGRDWKGLSPFTNEKTPSFVVHPDRGFYKCFSTQKGGDQIQFIREVENLEFNDAVELIAKRFNITLEYESGGPSRDQASIRKQLFEIHERAGQWFHQHLVDSTEAAPVREYWTTVRAFARTVAAEHMIGYAPAAPTALAEHLVEQGFGAAALQQSGLFFARQGQANPGSFKARFRGRLMIPIRDVQGRVVAFTARQLEQTPEDDPSHKAKYVNSPETQIFHKGRLLFGMHHARTHIKDGGGFLVVEGQLDAIRCWSVGLDTAVAPQGTAITEDHLNILRRYDPRVIECLLDGDKAGRAAALRILPLVFKSGLEFRFLLLPENADPDALLRDAGSAALDALRAQSKTPLQLAIESHLPTDREVTPGDKQAALKQVFSLVRLVESAVLRDDLLLDAARLLRVDSSAVFKDFQSAQRNTGQRDRSAPADAGLQPASAAREGVLTDVESKLLSLLLHFPEYGVSVAELFDDEWISTDRRSGELLRRLVAEFREGLFEDVQHLDHVFETPADQQFLTALLTTELDPEQAGDSVANCLTSLYRTQIKTKISIIDQQLANMPVTSPRMLEVMTERKRLRSALNTPLSLRECQ